jgi:curved DNA-binding protein CbpA
VPSTATVPEIKQAYRKLVMIYHPDKNNDDPYALTRFNEIKEAYEVLMNPGKKELYLQERWLRKAGGHKIGEEMVTAPVILIKSLELNKQVAAMDVYRMSYGGMVDRIIALINNSTIDELLSQKETDVQEAIIHSLLSTTKHFPYKETKLVADQLRKLSKDQPQLLHYIDVTVELKRKKENLNKFNGLFVFLLTILLCLLIYLMGR